jgi:hypothetical protein
MLKVASSLFAIMIVGWVLVDSAGEANARTKYVYRTVHEVTNVTRYRDTWRTSYVERVHRVVHVTRIQPVVHVHVVNLIHVRTVAAVRHVNVWVTRVLPAEEVVTSKTVHIWE